MKQKYEVRENAPKIYTGSTKLHGLLMSPRVFS